MPLQNNRFASVTTPLGPDVLLFSRMSGYEEMSRLFEYEVDLLVENKSLGSIVTAGFPVNKVLGQAMTVALESPSGDTRYYHGLVTQFRHHGAADDCFLYRAVLSPWLWFLTRTSNCRIFQDKSVPDIIKKVFADNGFNDFKMELTNTYKPRNYCVQYRETDFNFVSRLMEYEGIFYFFEHEKTKHTLVIADSINAYQTIADYATIPYFPPENVERRKQDHIFEWHTAHKVQSGTYVLNDYDFEKPKSNLVTKFIEKKPHSHAEGEQYDYPGNYFDPPTGETYANIRLDELQTDYEVIQGRGNAMGLTTGMLFSLEHYYIDPENIKYVVISANFLIVSNQYRSTSDEETLYECNFKAIRSTQQFRPQRLTSAPFVQGPQTATVVGKVGEEIWTDKYGRIKVQFHWDREGKMDESSSCWVRVSHPWAGKNWGAVSIPRIGQEVIVDFLEGNPDRPIITGRVYNALQLPPYGLPAAAVVSGIKSNTHKGKGYNEMSMDDTAGKEKITIHGQYDMNTTVEHDQTNTVKNDFTETITQNAKIEISKGTYNHDVKTGTATYHVTAALTENYDNTQTTTVLKKITIETKDEIYVLAAKKITLETGSSKLEMIQDGTINLTGKDIKIIGSSKVSVSAPNVEISGTKEVKTGVGMQSVTCDTAKLSTSGTSISQSAVGTHEITGAIVKIN